MSRVAIVTGATRNLGLALAQQLAERLGAGDVVYLTGRDRSRVGQALLGIDGARAELRGEVVDVSAEDALRRFGAALADRHGGVDIVFSNAYSRVDPDDDPARVINRYVAVNNLATTAILRIFSPLLRDGGRLLVVASSMGTLRYLPPVLHPRFERLETIDDVDHVVRAWRDAVRSGNAAAEAWPAWINIPSKVAQVAAVRVTARQRREDDRRRQIMIGAVCPGLVDTGASRPWFARMDGAQTPAEAARPLVDLALGPVDSSHYGELLRFGKVLQWTT